MEMNLQKIIACLGLLLCCFLTGCSGNISDSELEKFFRKHTVDGNVPVALKKKGIAESYLATIHGFPDNMSVCNDLAEPYNNNPDKSVIMGEYYCKELR